MGPCWTGATGGVGSIALLLLSRLGRHQVVGRDRKASEAPYLRSLGATEIWTGPNCPARANPAERTLERGGRWGGTATR